jgi:aminoglycoside 6'-N-acetyltransferase
MLPVMRQLPVLSGERVTLRPVRDDDAAALLALLSEPSVAAWWQEWDAERVRAMMTDGEEPALAIEAGGELVGLLLLGEEDYPMYRHASLDIAIATAHQGRGLGPEALRLAIRHLIEERGHHRFTIDPAAANERAIRAYSRLGFKPVGVLRRYERHADGEWHDCLLMDLLADELI